MSTDPEPEHDRGNQTESSTPTGGDRDNEGFIPHNRRQSFEYAIPSDVPRFYDADQLSRVRAIIDHAHSHDQLPRFWFTGPTGCGKTTAARRLAQDLEAPLFTVQGLYDIKKTDLLGQPTLVDGTVFWEDGPVTRALRASNQRQTVLLLDEVNRARPEAKGVLFPLLDGRAKVQTGRGSEIITGDPYNLIVIVTTNEGPEYATQQLDLAEKRRFGIKFEMTYLGQADFEAGVTLLTNRTPLCAPLARVMLTAANKTRELAAKTGNAVDRGIPTAKVLEWGTVATIYAQKGQEDPLVRAFDDVVTKPYYDENPDATQTVRTIITSYLGGAPVADEPAREWVRAKLEKRLRDEGETPLVQNVLAGDTFDRTDLTLEG